MAVIRLPPREVNREWFRAPLLPRAHASVPFDSGPLRYVSAKRRRPRMEEPPCNGLDWVRLPAVAPL